MTVIRQDRCAQVTVRYADGSMTAQPALLAYQGDRRAAKGGQPGSRAGRALTHRGILVSVDAMRSAQQVGREILAALEAMRPFLDQVPALARRSVDLTGPGDAFGATGPTAGTSG